jgi:REP element-mobilizing transposase RayT
MPRLPRIKTEGEDGWYHLWNAAAGEKRAFPLENLVHRRKLIGLLRYYAGIYFCRVAAFEIMGGHFHLVMRFDKPRPLFPNQLKERAYALYPNQHTWVDAWPEEKWKRLEQRLFDVSEFMRNLEEAFARWFNRLRNRKGHFWAARFKSNVLGGPQAVLDAVLYVELNGVRAGLVECPEDYKGGSLYLREANRDDWLMPLRELLYDEKGTQEELHARFKELCYYRGAVITKKGQKAIRPEVIEREKARGFAQRGVFLKKLRCITDGLVFGAEADVLTFLAKLRLKGQKWALRRKEAAKHLDGAFYTLRKQRDNYVPT